MRRTAPSYVSARDDSYLVRGRSTVRGRGTVRGRSTARGRSTVRGRSAPRGDGAHTSLLECGDPLRGRHVPRVAVAQPSVATRAPTKDRARIAQRESMDEARLLTGRARGAHLVGACTCSWCTCSCLASELPYCVPPGGAPTSVLCTCFALLCCAPPRRRLARPQARRCGGVCARRKRGAPRGSSHGPAGACHPGWG